MTCTEKAFDSFPQSYWDLVIPVVKPTSGVKDNKVHSKSSAVLFFSCSVAEGFHTFLPVAMRRSFWKEKILKGHSTHCLIV